VSGFTSGALAWTGAGAFIGADAEMAETLMDQILKAVLFLNFEEAEANLL
jgi:hypothetical protein